ncbi:MAG: bacterial/archaeal transporter family protein [Solirubrobacteraceae bacterium]|jgi:uncharacterized membrane protein|nr:bacterial/archaeal transporter family protein [Solirubrobacteraceae bacterium]
MWLAFALATVALWSTWGFLGKIALRHAHWTQATLWFGIAAALVCLAVLAVRGAEGSWGLRAVGMSALTGLAGGLGLATFYLALERGAASSVVPLIGTYPAGVALLSLVFLGESLSTVQIIGIVMSVGGVCLLAAGS